METVYLSPSGMLIIGTFVMMCLLLFAGITRLKPGNTKAMYFWQKVMVADLLLVIFLCTLSAFGFFDNPELPARFAPFGVLNAGMIVFLLIKARGEKISFRRNGIVFLLAIQTYRVIMEIILVMLYNDKIVPKDLTLHGINFDIFIGVTAPVFALIYFRSPQRAKLPVIIWNVLGILSLVNIILIAVFSIDLPFRVFDLNYLPHYFPGILIPSFLAPLAVFLHIVTIKAVINHNRS